MRKIGIIILNYNGGEDTISCLESLCKVDTLDYSVNIVVVDNASTDKSAVKIKDYVSDLKRYRRIDEYKLQLLVIENSTNLGFAGGNNIGIRYVLKQGADYVVILNNDTIVDRHFLEELLTVSKKHYKEGIVVPKIYFAPHHEFHSDRYAQEERGKVIWYAGGIMDWNNIIGHHRGVDEVDKGQYDEVVETDFATGCCMMVGRNIFEKVGLFDERYFLYYEDSDLSERVKKAGFKILYAPKAVVWHKNAGSTGGSGSKLQDYYITRNRLLFAGKFAPFRIKPALLKENIRLLLIGRKYQRKGVTDYYLGRFGKGRYEI